MNKYPLVSVLIPCYNHENFLADCLNSIINQNYDNIELLICDDCSSDNSYDLITKYKEMLISRFVNVKIEKNNVNQGITRSLNCLIKHAKGEYIKIIASDDALAPSCIKDMVECFRQNDDAGVIISNGMKVTENQHYPEFDSLEYIYSYIPDFSSTDLFFRTVKHNDIFAPGAMIKKEVFDKFGLYDESVKIEDFEFWLRLLKSQEVQFKFLDKVLIFYRISSNSMTSSMNNDGLEIRRNTYLNSMIKSIEKYQDYFSNDEYTNILLSYYIDEIVFSISTGLVNWEKKVKVLYKEFANRRKISFTRIISYEMKFFLIKIKYYLKLIIKK